MSKLEASIAFGRKLIAEFEEKKARLESRNYNDQDRKQYQEYGEGWDSINDYFDDQLEHGVKGRLIFLNRELDQLIEKLGVDDLSDLDRPLTDRECNPYYDLPLSKQQKIKEIQKNYRAIFADVTDNNIYYQGYLGMLEDQGLPLIHWCEWVRIEQQNQQRKIDDVVNSEID